MPELSGQSAGGAFVGALGAPVAIAANAAAYVVATGALLRMRTRERRHPPRSASLGDDLRAGWSLVLRSRPLRTLALANATNHLGLAIAMAVYYVYAFRTLSLTPLGLGVAMGCANVGIFGALLAGRIADRLGLRATLAAMVALSAVGGLAIPLGAPFAPLAALVAGRALITFAGPIFDVQQQAWRARAVAPPLHGRMNATMRAIVWGALPLGSALGGALAEPLGLVPTMLVGALVMSTAPLWFAVDVGLEEPSTALRRAA